MEKSTCQACVRIMKEESDFPSRNFSSAYCVDCVDEKGNLKSKEAVRQNMINYRMKYNGMTEERATEVVDDLMPRIPTWKGTFAAS